MTNHDTIIRFLFTVVSWLPVPLVLQVTGPRATTVNMIRTISLMYIQSLSCILFYKIGSVVLIVRVQCLLKRQVSLNVLLITNFSKIK